MKRKFIITGSILLLAISAQAYEKVYLQQYPSNYSNYGYQNRTMRPMYRYNNLYRYQFNQNPYRVQYLRTNTLKDRILNKLFGNYYNRLTFLNFNKNNGTMTGYSTPISSDVYKELGLKDDSSDDSQNKQNTKQRLKSPTCNTDLFSNPIQNSSYDKSKSTRSNNGGGTASKTGVTIIYD